MDFFFFFFQICLTVNGILSTSGLLVAQCKLKKLEIIVLLKRMESLSVSLSVLRFSQQPFIRLTSHLVGVLLRTQESAVSSVKSFGRAFVEKTASKKHHPAELQSPRSYRQSSSKPTLTDLHMRGFQLQSVTTLTI